MARLDGRPPRRPALSTMNTSAVVLVSVVLSAAAATGVSFALRPGEPPPDPTVPDMQRAIADLRAENAELQKKLAELHKAPAPVSTPASVDRAEAATVSPEQVAAAVEAYLRKRGGAVAADGAAGGSGKPAFDMDKDFADLIGDSYWEDGRAWKKAYDAGVMDAVIKKFEDLAKAAPNDTKVQMNLANAYLAYLQFDQTKWPLSMKADAVFDNVLAIDEKHWEARFTKAVSYTFWPDFLGKKNDAISHFETLIQQQESLPVEDYHAETYLYLGNLLEQRDPAKAREIWRKGARRHPQSAELAKKLAQ